MQDSVFQHDQHGFILIYRTHPADQLPQSDHRSGQHVLTHFNLHTTPPCSGSKVRMRDSDLTFENRFCCCAFTIRACSCLTCRVILCQSSWFQTGTLSMRMSLAGTFLISHFDLLIRLHSFHCNLRPVRSLHAFASHHSMLSSPLQRRLRFFGHLLPASPWTSLAGRFPVSRGNSGLPRSAWTIFLEWFRLRLFTGTFLSVYAAP